MSETHYAQLKAINPEAAERLLELNQKEAKRRYASYKRMETLDFSK